MAAKNNQLRKSISVMIKPASGACNLQCSYCFYRDEMKHRSQADFGMMPPQIQEAVYQKLGQTDAEEIMIAFQGGEPMLAGLDYYRRCISLQEKYLPNRSVAYALQTNATLLNEEWCRFLGEHHFLVGVSLDGMKALHDAYRTDSKGDGSFDKVMEGIQFLKTYHVEFNILTVVNARTAPRIRRIYENYKKWGFDYQQYIACLDPLDQSRPEFCLTAEAFGKSMTELWQLWTQDLYRGQQPYIRMFENYLGILLGYPPQACEQRGICTWQNIIEADGSVYPCDFYVQEEHLVGNVTDPAWKFAVNGQKPEFVRADNTWEIDASAPEECRACRYYGLCRNGCKRMRTMEGTGGKVNQLCSGYRYFFDHCLQEMQAIAAQMRGR